mgnify:CR=1 FL=1
MVWVVGWGWVVEWWGGWGAGSSPVDPRVGGVVVELAGCVVGWVSCVVATAAGCDGLVKWWGVGRQSCDGVDVSRDGCSSADRLKKWLLSFWLSL